LKRLKEFQISQHFRYPLNLHFGLINVENDLFECTTLCHNHIEYHQSNVYISGLAAIEEKPSFIQIIRIVRVQTKWMLFIDQLRTKCYNDNFCAWQIETVEDFSLVDILPQGTQCL
jgi:hypothetical protein